MDEHITFDELLRAKTMAEPGAEEEYRKAVVLNQVAEVLHELRTSAGMTQEQLAERMGTGQTAVARLEGGAYNPSVVTLDRAFAALGVDAVLLVAGHRVSLGTV